MEKREELEGSFGIKHFLSEVNKNLLVKLTTLTGVEERHLILIITNKVGECDIPNMRGGKCDQVKPQGR